MKSQGRTPDLTKEDLAYLIEEGYTRMLRDSLGFHSSVAFQTGSALVELGERSFIVGSDHQGDLCILELDPAESNFISRGAFGSVLAQPNILHEGRGVLKTTVDSGIHDNDGKSREEYLALSTDLLKLEGRVLDKLWDGVEEPIEGVQHPPYMTISTTLPGQEVANTFIYTKRYEGKTLDEWSRGDDAKSLSKSALVNLARQGLSGLAHARERNIVNGDIKDKNICIDLDPEGNPSLRIIDWGGAVDLDETPPPIPWLSDSLLTASTHTAPADRVLLNELTQEYWLLGSFSRKHAQSIRERFNNVQYARDTLSLSAELVHAMTGNSPLSISYGFEPSIDVYSTRQQAIQQLEQCGYPDEIQNIFAKLLEPNPEDRLSPAEALQSLDQMIDQGGEWLDFKRDDTS